MSVDKNKPLPQTQRVDIEGGQLIYRPESVPSDGDSEQKVKATYKDGAVNVTIRLGEEDVERICTILKSMQGIID